MDLYKRDSSQTGAFQANQDMYSQRDENVSVSFVKSTYQLFAASLLAGTVGAYVGVGMAGFVQSWFWGFIILEIALLVGLHFVKKVAGLNLAVLFAFTFISGLTIGPLLAKTLGMAGGANIVASTFLMTTVIFGSLSVFAMNTTRDFTILGKPLFITLIVIVVVSLLNVLIFRSPILQVGIAGLSTLLFSIFILFDTQNIIKGNYETPIDGAIALYLDFFNLFVSLLQIFGFINSSDD